MQQVSAFPVELVQVDPANLGTADAAFFAEGANGAEYCVKTCDSTPKAPAAEFICHAIAASCSIPVPGFDVVQMPVTRALAFGSAWEGAAVRDRQALLAVLTGAAPGIQVGRVLSRIYAFDTFVHNPDRHLGNYLCVPARTGYSLKAFDFSRAFSAASWPLPSLPMDSGCRTVSTYRRLRTHHGGFDRAAAFEVLSKIDALSFDSFKRLVEGLPPPWLDAGTRRDMLRWWVDERKRRTDAIRRGLDNGSLL